VLQRKWSLGDVDDVEAVVRSVLVAELAKRDVQLRADAFDDALAHLLSEAWIAWDQFDPGRGLAFSTYLRQQLKLRHIDHIRKVRGRTRWRWSGDKTYEREARPSDLHLDAAAPGSDEGRSLGETIAARSGDDAADSAARTDVQLLASADLHSLDDLAVIQAAFAQHPPERTRRDKARALAESS
jgi:DNA-directed RNA polymerase specialized sigma24 family protein